MESQHQTFGIEIKPKQNKMEKSNSQITLQMESQHQTYGSDLMGRYVDSCVDPIMDYQLRNTAFQFKPKTQKFLYFHFSRKLISLTLNLSNFFLKNKSTAIKLEMIVERDRIDIALSSFIFVISCFISFVVIKILILFYSHEC